MKSKTILKAIMWLVFPIVFNIVFYSICGVKNSVSIWISYGFVHISYLALALTSLSLPKGEEEDSFAYPMYFISIVYVVLTLIACGAFIYMKKAPTKAAIITNAVLTGLYVVIFIAHKLTGDKIQASVAESKVGAKYIEKCAVKLELLKVKYAGDDKINSAITMAYDVVHSSPTRSDAKVEHLEKEALEIIESFGGSQQSAEDMIDKANKIVDIFNERNTMLKYK